MIDAYASEPHYEAHILPVWNDLPPGAVGTFWVAGDRLGRVEDRDTPLLVASWKDLRDARAAGRRRFIYMEHGSGQSYAGRRHPSYAGGERHEDVELFLCPNDYSAAKWQEAYPERRVEVIGSPHVGSLPGRQGGMPTVAVSFHWDCFVCPETRTAFREYKDSLADLLRLDVQVIGHAHPRIAAKLRPHYERLGIPFVSDFADVCRQADIYVCDNSSTIFEFAALDRAVVVLNASWYRRHVEHGLRFWSHAGVGRNVDRPEDMAATVAAELERPQEYRGRRLELVADVVPFAGTEVAIEVLRSAGMLGS